MVTRRDRTEHRRCVEEPKCLIHAPNESVDPSEIEHIALAEALFLERYARAPEAAP